MEVKIGVTHANRELVIESSQSVEDIQKIVTDALNGDTGLLVLADEKGRTVAVPTDKLAYVDIAGEASRRVGFGPA
ncbi:MAG: DUF3107 domain-containing protein [Nocardioidaceae bacterium]